MSTSDQPSHLCFIIPAHKLRGFFNTSAEYECWYQAGKQPSEIFMRQKQGICSLLGVALCLSLFGAPASCFFYAEFVCCLIPLTVLTICPFTYRVPPAHQEPVLLKLRVEKSNDAQASPTWWCKRQPNNASTNLNTDGPGSWKTLICPGTNSDAAHVFMVSVSEFSGLLSNTNECRGEAAGPLKGMISSHNPAQQRLYWTRLYMRHFRKLKMPWFKLVKIVGQGDFNDHNQWSFSMIKCKSSSISSSRISLLSVCRVQVIKKVIKENERRLEETVRNHSFAVMSQRGGERL